MPGGFRLGAGSALTLAALLLIPLSDFGSVPRTIPYQGRLADYMAFPISGTADLTFSIYDGETAAVALWTETHSAPINGGLYDEVLGESVFLGLNFGSPCFLGVTAGGGQELAPRDLFTVQPYVMRAETADSVNDGAITAAKIGESCAIGQMLVMTASGWACGPPPY